MYNIIYLYVYTHIGMHICVYVYVCMDVCAVTINFASFKWKLPELPCIINAGRAGYIPERIFSAWIYEESVHGLLHQALITIIYSS